MKQTLRSSAVSYSLMEHLGEGLNSIVYKAVRFDPLHHLKQTVALKILKSRKLVDIWKNEFAALEKVVCKHCVRVYGFEWVGERPALILEYVNGVSLRQLCLTGPLSQKVGREILAQIQVGLLSLRDQGLCHGDLSPNNIMIDETGLVRLLDFGGANVREGQVQTTQAFAAKEIISGSQPNFLSDLYSLGVIERMLLQKETSRLSDEPSARQPLDWNSEESSRKKLAHQVCRARDLQNRFERVVTRSLAVAQQFRFPFLQGLALLFVFMLAPKSQSSFDFRDAGLLKIRTQSWTKLAMDGQEIGFAPQDILLNAGGSHRLTWQSQSAQGRISVRLNRGQIRILDEKELGD